MIFRTLFDNGGRIFDSALCMEGEQDKIISAMVLGTGAYGTEMVKNLSWFCQMSGYKLFVNAFDKAPNSESRFKSLCPELLSEKRNGDFSTPGEAHYRIDFIPKRMFLPMNLMKSFALCRAQHIFWFLWETTSLI